MAVLLEFSLAADAFPFGRALGGDPSVRVALERVIPLDVRRIPFVWASGDDFEGFERGLEASDIVTSADAVVRVGDHVLYSIEWDVSGETFLNGLAEAGGVIVEAHGDATWSFTVRFRSHRDLTTFHRFYQERDVPVRIERVYSLDEAPATRHGFGLTPGQREALVLAVENGYFAVPRETQLEEIADELGVTRQAASERIRRAAETVLRRALLGLSANDFQPAADD